MEFCGDMLSQRKEGSKREHFWLVFCSRIYKTMFKVVERLENIRQSLTKPSNMMVHMAADLDNIRSQGEINGKGCGYYPVILSFSSRFLKFCPFFTSVRISDQSLLCTLQFTLYIQPIQWEWIGNSTINDSCLNLQDAGVV